MSPTTAITEQDVDEPHQLNTAQRDNSEAATTNKFNEEGSDKQSSEAAQMMISSDTSTSSQTTTPIKAARARRQSLRSYLQNVSLSDVTEKGNNNTAISKTEVSNNGGTSYGSNKQPNRRRRLEVMGLLQHLKIHRYEDTTTNSSLTTVQNNSDSNNSHSISVGSLENDGKFANESTNVMGNTAPTTAEINQTSTTSLSNTNTPLKNTPVVEQKCLLHPTVRLRNDKCSLCCALAKTLEVRRAKEQKNNYLKKNKAAVGNDVSVGVGSGASSEGGGVEDTVVSGGANEDCINRRGDDYDNENKSGSNSDGGGGKDGDNSNERNVVLVDDDINRKECRDASPSNLTEETAAVKSTIAKSSIDDATECVVKDENDLQGEHDNHHLKLFIEEKQLHTRDAEQQPEEELVYQENSLPNDQPSNIRTDGASSCTIVAVTKATREVEAPANDDLVPQSTIVDRGEPQCNLIDNPTASTPATVSEGLLPDENYCGPVPLSMTEPAASLNDDDNYHGGDSNCSSKETPPITKSSLSTTAVPLTKLQRTIALAKGALDSKKSRQQRDGQASSTVMRRRSDAVVVGRSSPSCESLRSDIQPPPSSQEKVAVPTTNSATSSFDTSEKSTSDSSPLNSLTVEDCGRESNNLGRHLGATRLPSKVGDDDDNTASKPYEEGDYGDSALPLYQEDSFGSTSDVSPRGENREVAVSPPTHATVMSSKSSITVTGPDPKNSATIQSANDIIVEDVDSDSEKEDDCGHLSSSTKTVEIQSRPKAVDDTTTSNEQQEGNDEERIQSETDTTSLGTSGREMLDKKEDSATEQTSSPTSVMEEPSTTSQNDATAEEGAVDSTAASREERSKDRQDSSHANSASSTGEDSSDKQQKQFSEVERRLSRANQRLSRSITQRDNINKRRSRSRTRSVDSKGFFAALVENARSRSSSRTRQRSRSRSVTRKGDENTNKAEKELETRQRSRSKSVTRKGGDDASKGDIRKLSRSRSVRRNGESESINNMQEKRRPRSSSRSAAKKDGFTRERSQSTARKSVENTRAEEIKNAGGNRSRSVSKARKNMEANKRGKVTMAKDEEDCSDATAYEGKLINDNKDIPIKEISSSRPNQVSSEPTKMIHLPDPHGMTVKALKVELNMFNVDYSSFNEKEQFIAAAKHLREIYQRPQFDITSMKLNALKVELAMYDVDYSSFREKSEFMEALRDAREASKPESAPQQEEASPQEGITGENTEGLNLKVMVREPITHPRYKLGDTGRDEDMIILPVTSRSRSGRGRQKRDQDSSEASSADEDQDSSDQSKIIASVMELQHLDAAFIRRSDGRWTYALVVNGDDNGIRFVLNQQGSTKMLAKEKWKKNVRRIKVLTQRKGDVLNVNDKPPRRRRGKSMSRRSLSKTRRKGRLASPSPTRFYRYRRVDTLKLPPTITEGEVFVSKGMDMVPKVGLKWQRIYSQASTDVLPAHLRKEDI